MKLVLSTDGASRGNPGPAGAGWVLADTSGNVIETGNYFLGRRTNNEAEYEAVIRGLMAVQGKGADEVLLRSDSELVIKQLSGEYRVRNRRLADLYAKAYKILRRFKIADLQHVPRGQNRAADACANEAIDSGLYNDPKRF